MAKSTMQEEIEFTSQEYTSHTTKIDSYIRVLRGKMDDYEKKIELRHVFYRKGRQHMRRNQES